VSWPRRSAQASLGEPSRRHRRQSPRMHMCDAGRDYAKALNPCGEGRWPPESSGPRAPANRSASRRCEHQSLCSAFRPSSHVRFEGFGDDRRDRNLASPSFRFRWSFAQRDLPGARVEPRAPFEHRDLVTTPRLRCSLGSKSLRSLPTVRAPMCRVVANLARLGCPLRQPRRVVGGSRRAWTFARCHVPSLAR
jgi:hypothetical protein